jgi:hypothetical protein
MENVKNHIKMLIDIKESHIKENPESAINYLHKSDIFDLKLILSMIEDAEKEAPEVEAQKRKEEIAKLEELCKPVAEYLKSNYDPYATVVITDSHIKLYRGEIGIPVRNYDLL